MSKETIDRARLQDELKLLEAQFKQMTKGKVVMSSRAAIVHRKIKEKKKLIAELDQDAYDLMAVMTIPEEEIIEVLTIPLLADVMNDLVAGVDGMLRRAGAQETMFGYYTKQIKTATYALINSLENAKSDLPDMLACDDTLVDAIKKKLKSFVIQRLKLNKK